MMTIGRRRMSRSDVVTLFCLATFALAALIPDTAAAAKIRLKDQRVLEGKVARIKAMTADPQAASDGIKPVLLIDDDLRRVFVPMRQIEEVIDAPPPLLERFNIPQQIPGGGSPVASVGLLTRIERFDDFGRRIVTMKTADGPRDIIQGIELLTPYYAKVAALKGFKWDMRIATSALPPDTVRNILLKTINHEDFEHRLRLVRFYLQSDRFKDAREELKRLVEEFPEQREAHAGVLRDITQLDARWTLREIEVRQGAGQHRLANALLRAFPTEGVAGETLQRVQDLLDEYDRQQQQATSALAQLSAHHQLISDEQLRNRLAPHLAEIAAEMSLETLPRLATYQQFASDDQFLIEQKLAFALSGWLLGAKGATDNLSVALSLYEVRELAHQYFNEDIKVHREQLLAELQRKEGATPELLARLLAHMKPPRDTPPQNNVGSYQLTVESTPNGAPITYYVQLPPEYDPHRKYPAVVTLHGGGSSPELQLEWWCGGADANGLRRGQAARHGYIVIAPAWGAPHQGEYDFSLREHLAVLNSLRDACRRFSVDTDRVFLSGHSMGGDAAWDIGLAHPDLWAGVIPIVARCQKYCDFYWPNARQLPLYVVAGELDGSRMELNALSLDRYMGRGYPVTVVAFQGRGHEHFSDEIHNIFDWMQRYRRDFFLRSFEVTTLRDFDNYFWWAELEGLPEKLLVNPPTWPPARGQRGVTVKGDIGAANNVRVNSGAARTTVWLSPEVVNYALPVRVSADSRSVRLNLSGDISVMLEDARARGDRQHPFWDKVVLP